MLELASVRTPSRKDYYRRLQGFQAFVKEHSLPPTTGVQVDQSATLSGGSRGSLEAVSTEESDAESKSSDERSVSYESEVLIRLVI